MRKQIVPWRFCVDLELIGVGNWNFNTMDDKIYYLPKSLVTWILRHTPMKSLQFVGMARLSFGGLDFISFDSTNFFSTVCICIIGIGEKIES
jgi:hypothetical protein